VVVRRMFSRLKSVPQIVAGALVIVAMLGLDASSALAQSASCAQLNSTLQSLSRNRDFLNADQADQDAKSVAANERNAESAYIRTGCQQAQQAGMPQTPECRGLAKQILSGRAQYAQLTQSVQNGGAVAQQRELVLQQIARFNCGQQRSQAQFSSDNGNQPPLRHRNFLEQLFGGFQNDGSNNGDYNNTQDQVEDPYANGQTQNTNTIRTVCVRTSDGYYWPVSYSTVRDYIPQDTAQCQSECPGQSVDLYYYDNPGQEPEQMVNANGTAYTSLPTAFLYRKQFDRSITCKSQVTEGQITVDDLGNGQTRAMVNFQDQRFPLPIRDPRRAQTATTAPAKYAQVIDIPLPRPRPAAPGAAAPPMAEPVVSARDRTVKVGDKIVRIVGPDTPYAPVTAAGT
jgi:hypothetical protein